MKVSPWILLGEFVEPQFFSFSKKRSIVWVENREEMSYEGTPVKAPPTSRRRMMPPTPQQLASVDGRDAVASGDGGIRKQLECS